MSSILDARAATTQQPEHPGSAQICTAAATSVGDLRAYADHGTLGLNRAPVYSLYQLQVEPVLHAVCVVYDQPVGWLSSDAHVLGNTGLYYKI